MLRSLNARQALSGAARAALLLALSSVVSLGCGKSPAPVAPTTGTAEVAGTGGSDVTPPAQTAPWERSGLDWNKVPAPGPEPTFTPPKPEVFTLPNGLTVLVIENHRLPLVSAVLVNRLGGAALDPAGKEGLAALTADLLDEGAGKKSALEISDALERLGASLSIVAGSDAAELHMDTLAETLPESLALLSEIVTKPTLSAGDFDRVKGDRLAQLELRPAQARLVASLVFDRVLYGSHAYGAPGDGFATSMKPLTLAQVKAHYRAHYVPKEMVLVVAGDTTRATLAPLLDKSLGAWRGGKGKATVRKEAPATVASRLVFVDKPEAPQSVVRIGRIALAQGDPSYPVATIVNTVLGGSFASRLNNQLREVLGYTYGASSFFWFARSPGVWSVATSLKTEVTIEGIKEAFRLIEGMRAAAVPDDELAKAKQLRTRALPQEFETNAGTAGAFAELMTYGHRLDWYETLAGDLDAVTAAQAKAFATEWWSADDLRVVIVGDLAKLAARLPELGLGEAARYDTEGAPLK